MKDFIHFIRRENFNLCDGFFGFFNRRHFIQRVFRQVFSTDGIFEFKYAIRRKYLPKDALDEMAAIEKPEEAITEIEIFSPDEMNEILHAARPEITAWLAIAAFAGLRTAELQRLDWRDINPQER